MSSAIKNRSWVVCNNIIVIYRSRCFAGDSLRNRRIFFPLRASREFIAGAGCHARLIFIIIIVGSYRLASKIAGAILSTRADNIFTFHLLPFSLENYAIDPTARREPIPSVRSSSALYFCSVFPPEDSLSPFRFPPHERRHIYFLSLPGLFLLYVATLRVDPPSIFFSLVSARVPPRAASRIILLQRA